jgi:glycosyltransferase involved in cell wall biosynthesis
LRISVITPSFNSGKTIARSIESVLSQDYADWEHIIIDGGSTDGTVEIILKYPHLNCISEPDEGQADAMNKGFLRSKGEIIVYLNADDYFLPGAFASVASAFTNGAVFVVGNILMRDNRTGVESLSVPRIDFEGMLHHWLPNAFCYNPVGYFYRRCVQEKCPFNIQNQFTMDLEFLLSAASQFRFTKIEKTLGCFVDYENSKTHKSQLALDHWQPSTFSYLDQYVEKLSEDKQKKFRTAQLKGYKKLAAYWRGKESKGLKRMIALTRERFGFVLI